MTTWQPTKQRDGRGRFKAREVPERQTLGGCGHMVCDCGPQLLGSHPAGAPKWDGSALQAVPAETVQTARRRAMEAHAAPRIPAMSFFRSRLNWSLFVSLVASVVALATGEVEASSATVMPVVMGGIGLALRAQDDRQKKRGRVVVVDNRP